MAKSLILTYFLWLFGGFFGLHHFYLRRDGHAFVWWTTLGGFFGLGWFRDVFHIKRYVDDANEEPNYMEKLHHKMFTSKGPPSTIVRSTGQFFVGLIYGLLFISAIPEPSEFGDEESLWYQIADWIKKAGYLLLPAVTSFGVCFVANIGRESGSYIVALVGAYLAIPCYGFAAENVQTMSLFASIALNWKGKSWKLDPRKKKGFCKRLTVFTLCCTIYLLLWSSMLYFNASMTTEDEEVVKFRDAAKNFFKSPAWQDTQEAMTRLWNYYNHHGWKTLWNEIMEVFDAKGEENAYKVLGVTSQSTKEEITSKYRKLARKFHPDKVKGEAEKLIAQEKFMEIQNSYEILTKKLNKRKSNVSKTETSDTGHDEF